MASTRKLNSSAASSRLRNRPVATGSALLAPSAVTSGMTHGQVLAREVARFSGHHPFWTMAGALAMRLASGTQLGMPQVGSGAPGKLARQRAHPHLLVGADVLGHRDLDAGFEPRRLVALGGAGALERRGGLDHPQQDAAGHLQG